MENSLFSLPLKNFVSIEDLSPFVEDYKSVVEKKVGYSYKRTFFL
jgi:hypothetical protein